MRIMTSNCVISEALCSMYVAMFSPSMSMLHHECSRGTLSALPVTISVVLDDSLFSPINLYKNYLKIQIFINVRVATILPPGDHNFGSHDRPRYNGICIIIRHVITRADCIIQFWLCFL